MNNILIKQRSKVFQFIQFCQLFFFFFSSEQGRVLAEVKAELIAMKENFLELKKLIRDPKRSNKMSDGGENSVNEGERKERQSMQGEKSNEEGEAEPRESVKKVELPIFEGVDPQGWLGCPQKFFEVQNVGDKERLKSAFISMEGSVSHWFKFWR